MNTQLPISRRQFLQTTAMAAATIPLVSAVADPPSSGKGKLKVGCLRWCFHDFSPAVDPEPAIDIIGGLGFDGIEMIVTARRDLKDFWTDERVDRYRKKLDQHKLQVSQFVLFQPVVERISPARSPPNGSKRLIILKRVVGLARN